MADIIYLTMKGNKQGLISAGCSSYDSIGNRYQDNHTDEILVYSTTYELARKQNVSHAPFIMVKADDKSSALLLSAISHNEVLDCVFEYYRVDKSGKLMPYKKIRLTKASIVRITNESPSSLTENELQSFEKVSLLYESISYTHIQANASGYSIRNEAIM
ncbi:type VI secretion system effector, Hcp1 family [Providencia rettgeri DSM 1131]|mgnify:CR=1 FL=1|uniref:Hcp family type VI secretion system effector n=1 Tax=Providencia rettgeri TaxID=587 RepID=UPI000197C52F|nr:Hcp family type VI secretion system effector [Providencia rettgeri]EFE53384.1 type VI secretion system effector, Hcp1 family [Providencia rettgeri DSM 1131]MBI6189351.1 Hcp family type VI secretion system effector [Providencia rettgeri]MCG9528324.1 Hcp family type VI secretion system effector [Providencia rettgeri]MCL0009802.1 Hcp family type VI secretion system effector [Providencia rettgeri]QXA59384.1 Hcp family type VI secretion system effector [Providencia rettgeri]